MSTCKLCRKKVRKAVTASIVEKGTVVSGRICRDCASGGVLLVASADKPLVCSCGKNVASVCVKCVNAAELKAAKRGGDTVKHVKHLKGLVKAYQRGWALVAHPNVAGLELAIDYLERAAALLKDG